MAESLESMPLFPLSTVVFPYAQILVHVFEERYRRLIEDCVLDERPFGVVLIRSGSEVGEEHPEPWMVGTAVRIVDREQAADGTLNVRVAGERRFRIRRLDESGPYMVGQVERVIEVETEDTPRTDALSMKARELFAAWVQHQISHRGLSIQVRFPDDVTALSFAIANFLPLENLDKQRLLELTDSVERLATLIPLLEEQILNAADPDSLLEPINPDDLPGWISRN